MCARLTGPLHSDDASGKIAKSIVASHWKGSQYMRMLVKTNSSKTEGQGDARLILGGVGRGGKPVDPTSSVAVALMSITKGANSWMSNFVKSACKNYFAKPIATSFGTIYTAYSTHTAKSSFDSNAATLGLSDFDVSYKSVANKFTGGMQLYVLAKYLCDIQGANPGLLASDPFDTALASWTGSEITAMLAEIAPAV